MSVHHWLLEQYPGFRGAQMALHHQAESARRAPFKAPAKPFAITVVVHVLYANAQQKATKTQVRSQIRVLNRDFRARNGDRRKTPSVWKGLVADAMVEFKLATRDPRGKASDGIVFKKTQLTEFGQNDSMKSAARGGSDPWPTERYLNIWVCTLKDDLLGYAQFPGGPKATTSGTARAPFNRGRTCTHEVGHYLNLRHIWGDTEDCSGGDSVDDTPNAETPNYGMPAFPSISCRNGPSGDMFMNYMDYVDDAAMFMFTVEQVARMHTALRGPRRSLW
jgi:hypothetical protein